MIDLKSLSPAPWEVVHKSPRAADEVYYDMVGPDGKVLFDTCNSDVMLLHVEHDEGMSHWWDETGRTNFNFIAAARYAFDVMMRRGWGVFNGPRGWGVALNTLDDLYGIREKRWPDPFTALVEADELFHQTDQTEKSKESHAAAR